MACKLVSSTHIYFDGGCSKRHIMEVCVVVLRNGRADFVRTPVGRGDAMQSEWLALLFSVAIASTLGLQNVRLFGDNASVISLAQGYSQSSNSLYRNYSARLNTARQSFKSLDMSWVARGSNIAGRYLESGNGQWFRAGLSMLEDIEEVKPLAQEVVSQSRFLGSQWAKSQLQIRDQKPRENDLNVSANQTLAKSG